MIASTVRQTASFRISWYLPLPCAARLCPLMWRVGHNRECLFRERRIREAFPASPIAFSLQSLHQSESLHFQSFAVYQQEKCVPSRFLSSVPCCSSRPAASQAWLHAYCSFIDPARLPCICAVQYPGLTLTIPYSRVISTLGQAASVNSQARPPPPLLLFARTWSSSGKSLECLRVPSSPFP